MFPRFSLPDKIISDNGADFVNNVIKEIATRLVMKRKSGCVYHPQSQGMVERANGIFKAKIAKMCTDSKRNWVEALPLALMGMNIQTNPSNTTGNAYWLTHATAPFVRSVQWSSARANRK